MFKILILCWVLTLRSSVAEEAILEENVAILHLVPEAREDKSGFDLLHPTPKSLMRDMSTDRPDQTESTRTLDAGHFQLESTLFSFSFDESGNRGRRVKTQEIEGWNTNYKVGLFNNIDLQLVIPSYTVARVTENGHTTVSQGFGDVTLRSKINLLSNDTDEPSVAVLPFLKLPTSQSELGNKSVEGGVIVPWSMELPLAWSMSGQAEMELTRESSHEPVVFNYGGTFEFSHSIIEKLSTFVEVSTARPAARLARWESYFNTGLILEITKNVRLDAGVNIGLSDQANDVKTFLGLSIRF